MKTLQRPFILVAVLIGAPASPLVTLATAYQCSALTEYVEMWDDSDQQNDTLGLYVRGTADGGGDPCNVTVRTYILAPNGEGR